MRKYAVSAVNGNWALFLLVLQWQDRIKEHVSVIQAMPFLLPDLTVLYSGTPNSERSQSKLFSDPKKFGFQRSIAPPRRSKFECTKNQTSLDHSLK